MKMIRVLCSVAVMLGLGYSQCTGGLFAMPMALAADVHLQQEIIQKDGSLMSKDITACFDDLMSHAQEDDHAEGDHIEQGHESACGDGAPCVRQTQQVLTMDRTRSASVDKDVLHDGKLANAVLPFYALSKSAFHARAGPLYEHSSLLAHTLIKRE